MGTRVTAARAHREESGRGAGTGADVVVAFRGVAAELAGVAWPMQVHALMHRGRFTLHNAVLIVFLIGTAVLLGANVALPIGARIPGMLLLAAIAGWIGAGAFPRGSRLSHVPSQVPARISRPSQSLPRGSRPSRRLP